MLQGVDITDNRALLELGVLSGLFGRTGVKPKLCASFDQAHSGGTFQD